MELRHLRYFMAVAEEHHFGRAAQRLHIAQPPLSRQIQALERELGFPLFDRARPRTEVTAAGAVLLAHTKLLFSALALGVHEAKRASVGESGRISVGYLSSLSYSGLTALLRSFRARYPAIELGLRELPPQEQIVALKNGVIDVGFVRAPLDDAALVSELVRREPLMAAVPDGHPIAKRKKRKALRVAQLAGEPFVMFPRERGPAFFDQLISLCHAAGFTPRIVQESPMLDVLALVAAGFGVSIVPWSLRNTVRDGVTMLPIAGAPTADLLLTWRAGKSAPAIDTFLEHVRKVGVHDLGVTGSARRSRAADARSGASLAGRSPRGGSA